MKYNLLLLLGITLALVACSQPDTKPFSEGTSSAVSAPTPSPSTQPIPVLWTAGKGFAQPESAYFDLRTSLIFVSNINGDPTSRDGNGYLSKLSMDGKLIQQEWVAGLNAPKGLRSYRDKLYVADIDEVVQIDIPKGKIDWKVKIEDAGFLNDVAVSNTGVVYVSDTTGSRIYALPTQGDDAKTLSILRSGDEAESPNGLLCVGNSLIVAAWGVGTKSDFSSEKQGRLYKITLANRAKTLITPKEVGRLDGLESDRNGGFLVSDWMSGEVMRISATGKVDVLIRDLKNPADLGYFARKRMLIVPEMGANRVTAYTLPN